MKTYVNKMYWLYVNEKNDPLKIDPIKIIFTEACYKKT